MAENASDIGGRPQAWSYLIDPSARLTLADIRAQRQQFQPLDKQAFTLPPSQ
ncbi:7TM-DISM domain-containing protein, partial [Phenylobacterium sp.]|uniref:7TM-DISM domain-containing protein n=1 Tax=Phenylobacterium sp. TaxID=1871053 RepID=UPI003FA74C5C